MLAACPLMQKTTGINVRRVDFSDPQGGKGSCDRKAATIKAHFRRFVNEGHDVLTAENFRETLAINFSKIISLECRRKLVSSPVLGSVFDYVKSNPSVCLAFELCFT